MQLLQQKTDVLLPVLQYQPSDLRMLKVPDQLKDSITSTEPMHLEETIKVADFLSTYLDGWATVLVRSLHVDICARILSPSNEPLLEEDLELDGPYSRGASHMLWCDGYVEYHPIQLN